MPELKCNHCTATESFEGPKDADAAGWKLAYFLVRPPDDYGIDMYGNLTTPIAIQRVYCSEECAAQDIEAATNKEEEE